MGDGAVGECHVQIEDVIDRFSVEDRSRTTGVVANHAAHGRAARGGEIGREPQAVRAELRI